MNKIKFQKTRINDLNRSVLNALKASGWDDEEIKISSESELLERFLQWHGIIGFTTTIINAYESIKKSRTPAGIPEYDISNVRILDEDEDEEIPNEVIDNPEIYGPDFVSLKMDNSEVQWHADGRVVIRETTTLQRILNGKPVEPDDRVWQEKEVWNFHHK